MKRLIPILLIVMAPLLLSSCDNEGGTGSGTGGSGSLALLSPNGGETWDAQSGTNPTISWTQTGAGDSVRIELYKSDSLFITLTVATENDGAYSLEIPPSAATSGEYIVKIVSLLDENITDQSETSFTITNTEVNTTPGSITVTGPNGGESWAAAESRNISWASTNAGSTVNVDLYQAGEFSLSLIEGTNNNGAYLWTVPSSVTTGSDYKIKVTASGNASVTDESDANLTITGTSGGTTTGASGSITVTSPNGGESWIAGETLGNGGVYRTISWGSSDAGSSVNIDLYKADQLYASIASSTENDGQHVLDSSSSWPAASDYQIKITDSSNSTISDLSDANFTFTHTGTIKVQDPNGGETWRQDETRDIKWSSNHVGSVDIDLYKSDDLISAIEESVTSGSSTDTTEYSWTIPDSVDASSAYKIRISDSSDSSTNDESDENFEISASNRCQQIYAVACTSEWTSNYVPAVPAVGVEVCVETTRGTGSPETVCATTGSDGRTPPFKVGYQGVNHNFKIHTAGVHMWGGAQLCFSDSSFPNENALPWGNQSGYNGVGCD